MTDKQARMETLKGLVENRIDGYNQQIFNTQDTFDRYLEKIEESIKKIREKKGYRFEYCKDIQELASRLRILCELDFQFASELGMYKHIQKDLEGL